MALVSTQLNGAITATQTLFPLTNGAVTGAPVVGAIPLSMGVPMLIDSEIMFWIAQPAANMCQVRGRGSEGTAAVTHDTLANVYLSALAGDFPSPFAGTIVTVDPTEDLVLSVGQDQTVTLPPAMVKNCVVNINKATAAALTLPAPSLATNALQLTFTSNTAAAHVITATGLIHDASGNLRNTATFTAQIGSSVFFVAENGFWNVIATLGVTFA